MARRGMRRAKEEYEQKAGEVTGGLKTPGFV